ncbi:RNA-directed DNA polymerase, eukaryota [Tanacetum coccineum]
MPALFGGVVLWSRDFDNFVMEEIKDFSAINNLRVLLANKGFLNVKLAYIGGLWVMIELDSTSTKEKFMQHVGVASWFARLCNAQEDFVSRERIVWVDIEGVPLRAWSQSTFKKIGAKWGEVMKLEENKEDMFARKRICIKTSREDNILERFKITVRGFTPVNVEDSKHRDRQEGSASSKSRTSEFCSRVVEEAQAVDDNPSPVPNAINNRSKTGGSILDLLDELIKVGNTMGYSLDGFRVGDERMGSVFNVRGARDFNNFITSAGLVDVQLEGYAFTWSHPSAAIERGLMMIDDLAEGVCQNNIQAFQAGEVGLCSKSSSSLGLSRGDEHSSFLHGLINMKRSQLSIKGIMVDGVWVDDPSLVKDEFRSHFAKRFQAPGASHFCAAVDWFFLHSAFAKGCNSSFIALIPKTPDAKFVGTLGYSLIGNTGLGFNVDFAKAYDPVRMDFLDDVLEAFGVWLRDSGKTIGIGGRSSYDLFLRLFSLEMRVMFLLATTDGLLFGFFSPYMSMVESDVVLLSSSRTWLSRFQDISS